MFDLEINLRLALSRGKDNGKMSDWASKAVEKLKQQEADRKREQEFSLLQRKQLDAGAPRLWEELKKTLLEAVTAFDKLQPSYLSMDASYQGLQKIRVEAPKAFLDLSFDAATPQLDYTFRTRSGSGASSSGYIIEVSDGDVLFTGLDHRRVGAQIVAEALLEKLLAYSGAIKT
jgi:hypothetical protein